MNATHNAILPSVFHTCIVKYNSPLIPLPNISLHPLALRTGGVLSSRPGRAAARIANPYLCDRLTDFLRSKFCGIV